MIVASRLGAYYGDQHHVVREDLHRNRDAIRAIALKHGASNLRVFGSVGRGEERPDSDIDFLIDLAETRGVRRLSGPGRRIGESVWAAR